MLVEDGQMVRDAEGTAIRNFAFLPRYISIRPPGWLMEYWMRSDPRLTYRDIKARMAAPVKQRPMDNTLNMRREREARNPLGLSCWSTRRGTAARVEVERVERWTHDQVAYNTTMDIEYAEPTPENRKMVPLRLKAKTLVPVDEPIYFPLNFFLEDSEGGQPRLHRPSERVAGAIELFYSLSARAKSLGLPSWHLLPGSELPRAWRALQGSRAATTSAGNAPPSLEIATTVAEPDYVSTSSLVPDLTAALASIPSSALTHAHVSTSASAFPLPSATTGNQLSGSSHTHPQETFIGVTATSARMRNKQKREKTDDGNRPSKKRTGHFSTTATARRRLSSSSSLSADFARAAFKSDNDDDDFGDDDF